MSAPNVKHADLMQCPACGWLGLEFGGWQTQHPEPGHWFAYCPSCTESSCASEEMKHVVAVKPKPQPSTLPAFLTTNQMDPEEQAELDDWAKEVAGGPLCGECGGRGHRQEDCPRNRRGSR